MELIKITEENGRKAVSARELYSFLGYDSSQWSRWYKKNIINNEFATEKEDWEGFDIESNGNKSKDFALSIQFAKKIAMLARTDKGEEARNYFIECEKKSKSLTQQSLPQNYIEALKALIVSEEEKLLAQKEVKELKPKGEFYDAVTGSDDTVDISTVAKVLNMGIGRNKLFQFLRDQNILMKNNQPYQNYIDRGYFRVIESTYNKPDGSTHISMKTVVFQSGIDYIRKQIEKKYND